MDPERVRQLLTQVASGQLGVEQAEEALAVLPFKDLGFARIDNHRALRQGMPEVVYGEGKSAEQIVAIGESVLARGQTLLVTRLSEEKACAVQRLGLAIEHNPTARTGTLLATQHRIEPRGILVITAGTSDSAVAAEAVETLRACGADCELLEDLGVAGLHRLLAEVDRLRAARVLIVVAGMEGALASVVGGLVAAPVIAVPTSVGYGAAFSGLAALLGMLTSCAAGVTCVNIDNGFGAAMAALRWLRVAPPSGGAVHAQ